jgi:hypothetical protein
VLAAFALGLSARREFAAESCSNNRAAWRFKIRFFAAGQACSTKPAPPLCKQVDSFKSGKWNNDLPRAQFVPNTACNRGHSRLIVVSPFLCM